MNIDFELLQKKHNDLISSYYFTINKVSHMPFVTVGSVNPFKPEFNLKYWITFLFEVISFPPKIVFRFLVDFFIQWHIKNKLGILIAIYAQLEQTIDKSEPKSEKQIEWLNSTQEGIRKFYNTLSIFSNISTFIRSLSIMFSGLFIPFIQILTKSYDKNILFQILVITCAFLFYSCFLISPSYNFKRETVLGKKFENSIDINVKSSNIHQIENDLFQILGRNMPKEISIGSVLAGFSLFIICISIFVGTIITPSRNIGNSDQILIILTGIGSMLFFGYSIFNNEIDVEAFSNEFKEWFSSFSSVPTPPHNHNLGDPLTKIADMDLPANQPLPEHDKYLDP